MTNRFNSLIASLTFLLLMALIQPALAKTPCQPVYSPAAPLSRPNQDSSGQLRLIHASPQTAPVSLLVDGEPLVADLIYRTASDWLAVAPGDHTLQLTTANSTRPVQIRLNVPPTQTMNIIVYEERSKPALLVFEQPAAPTPPTQAHLIAVNAAPTAPVLYALTDGSRLSEIPPIPYSRATRVLPLPADTYSLSWQTEQNATGRTIEESFGIELEAGYIYTAVITGDAAEPLLLGDFVGLEPPSDETLPPQVEEPAAANNGETGIAVRFINALAEPVAVDILLDDNVVISDLPPHTAITSTIIPTDNPQLRIHPANAPHEPAYFIDDDFPPLADPQQTTLLLYGPIDAIQVQAIPEPANVEYPDMAHLRVWHTVPTQDDLLIRVDNPLQPYTSPPISLGTATAAIPLPAGTYDIQILAASDSTLLALVPTLALADHTTYDLLLLPGENAVPFSLALLHKSSVP